MIAENEIFLDEIERQRSKSFARNYIHTIYLTDALTFQFGIAHSRWEMCKTTGENWNKIAPKIYSSSMNNIHRIEMCQWHWQF